ncbi:MAG: hypothetical protein L6R36_008135, partial [Xanthoria steineri]
MFSLLLLHLILSISLSTTSTTLANPLHPPSNRPILSPFPLLHPSSPNTSTTRQSPTPPTDPITCIRKPRLRHITEQRCAPILAPLLDNPPDCKVNKRYTAAITSFGASPCHIELRNTERGSVIVISDELVGSSALAVVRECEGETGAGWGQFQSSR